MQNPFKRWWPRTLRMRLILIVLPMVGLPIIVSGYFLKLNSSRVLAQEKEEHLYGVAALLVEHLAAQGGYEAILTLSASRKNRDEAIRSLNRQLSPYSDSVARAFPGVGVGYYHRGLDAIVTYGPSEQYAYTVGESISAQHPGRQVMSSGEARVENGNQVRGYILNAMLPLKIGNEVVGYVWANELISVVDAQAAAMSRSIYAVTALGLLLSILIVYFMVSPLARDVGIIKLGLERLTGDLNEKIEVLEGETGEIAEAINAMARSLLETRSMHHCILDSLGDAVITVDHYGRITYVNPLACRLLGRPAVEVIGILYADLIVPDQNFCSMLLDTLASGQAHPGVEMSMPLPDKTLHILTSTSSLRDNHGGVIGAVAVIRDQSEKFALQNQVARADRLAALGELASSIAHELRTPLTSIRGFVQYLQEGGSKEEWAQYGAVIIREIDRLNRIVSQLLEFARPRPLKTSAVQVNTLIEETLLLTQSPQTGKRVCFALQLADDLPAVRADAGQLKQVLLNLLINALQASPECGEIRVRSFRCGEHEIGMEIADSGSGIPPETLARVFDPFYSTKPEGTGLGLAVAKRIVDSHNGSLELFSTPGAGTTALLRLPTSEHGLPL